MKRRNVVLVCGSHKTCDRELIFNTLDKLHDQFPITLIVQGYARHTDMAANDWAINRNVPTTGSKYKIHSADWKKLGNGAGPWRNKRMLKGELPNLIVAFPGGRGTANMVLQGRRAFVKIIKVDEKGDLHESHYESFFQSEKVTYPD